MKRWVETAKRADFSRLAAEYGIDQVLARIMINRGVEEQDFSAYLHPSFSDINSPHLLKDADRAAALLKTAIEENRRIRIIGDYDIDGVMSTYILKTGLTDCGADVDSAIPDRIEDGYGINANMVKKAVADGVELIITCDNGIAAVDALQVAKDSGLTVIVTDHHGVPFKTDEETGEHIQILPPADAIVNPKQADCVYPYSDICGAVVAWKVIWLLYELYGREDQTAKFIEFAAFATIGDVMPLQKENRSIVAMGLKALMNTSNYGLKALIEKTELAGKRIEGYHIGFILGPCINATGRLESADLSLALLESKSYDEACSRADKLVELNNARKDMTQKGIDAAVSIIEEQGYDRDKVMVVFVPELHESLAGIVAGRIREKYYRPVIILTRGSEGVKGSGRSIEGYHMFEKLTEAAQYMTKFGGHAMAAGLSLEESSIDDFRDFLCAHADLTDDQLVEKLRIDARMPVSYITLDRIEQLDMLEPFGTANEKPLFAQKDLKVRNISRIGREGQYLKINFYISDDPSDYRTITGLYFGDAEEMADYYKSAQGYEWNLAVKGQKNGLKMTIAYYPQINEYRDSRTPQIQIRHYC